MRSSHDKEVIVEARDIYKLLQAPFFGATECIYCMIAAAAHANLSGLSPARVSPEPYEVLDGEGGEWGNDGWTHYMHMNIRGSDQLVLIKVTHDAACVTLELEERRTEEFDSAIALLAQGGDSVMFTRHDCTTWTRNIWAQTPEGEVTWQARPFTDLPSLIGVCADRIGDLLRASREDVGGSLHA